MSLPREADSDRPQLILQPGATLEIVDSVASLPPAFTPAMSAHLPAGARARNVQIQALARLTRLPRPTAGSS